MPTFSELKNSETPLLVDFSAEWCGPCKAMKPVLDELKHRVGDSANIIKVDVDKNPDAASAFRVQGVPTLILFHKGQQKWRQSGVMSAIQLEEVIRKFSQS